ncbi:MAG: cell division protein FtsZ [Chloroherpetonaceae bacterium]
MPFELDTTYSPLGAKIKIIGVGGCGGNAVNNMVELGIAGVEFIACNTDGQALSKSRAAHRLQIGGTTTKGLGAGFNPEVGKHAAEESREEISELIRGSDMLFITAGMGKGTGTGAAPVVANIARKLGILTIAIVTKPFEYEGARTMETALRGIDELRKEVDTLIVVQNEKILSIANGDLSVKQAYSIANDVLYRAAKGISEIVTKLGFVNVDFADVRNIMSDSGDALMGSATASGENRALRAAEEAISSPLLDGVSIKGSSGVLINITGDVTMGDMKEAMSFIHEQAGEGATIIHGHVEDDTMKGEITVTVIATGFNKNKKAPTPSAKQPELQVIRRAESKPVPAPPPISNPLVGGKMERMSSDVFEKNDESTPSFIKRGIPAPQPLAIKTIEEQNEQKSNDGSGDKIRKTNPETPAFLRKIMD